MRRNSHVVKTLVKMKSVLVFFSLILSSVGENEVFVLRALSSSIGDMVLSCQPELEFENDVIQDLLDFWNEKNDLRSADLGCALVCVFEENEFLNEDGTQVRAANVNVFFKAAGADEIMSRKLTELFQMCKNSTRTITNLCDSSLELAKCFRYAIFQLHWAPERDYWSRPQLSLDDEPEQVSYVKTLHPALRREMNQRKMFSKLFRSCRK